MKRTLTALAAAAIALTGLSGAAMAQPGPDRHGPPGYDRPDDRHDNRPDNRRDMRQDDRGPPGHAYGHAKWRKGQRVSRDEWRRYQAVDYRRHHLRRPPRGYEWRQVDGNYVLAAAATGLIAAIIAANH
jgi:Ni/Co efflux regulator RcnB